MAPTSYRNRTPRRPDGMQIIDPPVGPFSNPKDIRRWIKELEKSMPASPERDHELKNARSWLRRGRGHKSSGR